MKGQHRLDKIVAYLKNHTLVTVEQLVDAVDASRQRSGAISSNWMSRA
jgi:DeoR/GlpR family transcriptional regulator of sugar metabolism